MSSPTLIQTATPDDIPALRELFEAGVFEGQIRINDTGEDLEHLEMTYFQDDGLSGFWVAIRDDLVVGMIGVRQIDESVAEIRRLRVHTGARRQGIGTLLLKHAVDFCRQHDYVKVTLDVRIEREPAIQLFEKAGFFLARTRTVEGHQTLDFYVDLYREPTARD